HPSRQTDLCTGWYRSTMRDVDGSADNHLDSRIYLPLHLPDANRFDDRYQVPGGKALNECFSVVPAMRKSREQ
ncbi:MAG: hypothetical protein Q7K57_47620, partial [Burkholderiaceae bacterium]|nr:hypothetical protein [Burkholderiaceae bacterium]